MPYRQSMGQDIKIQTRNLLTDLGVECIILQIQKGFFQKEF